MTTTQNNKTKKQKLNNKPRHLSAAKMLPGVTKNRQQTKVLRVLHCGHVEIRRVKY